MVIITTVAVMITRIRLITSHGTCLARTGNFRLGSVIVLGPDAATTGGYPVVAVLSPAGRSALARLRPGAPVQFNAVRC